jgi:hypothetical protein
MTNWRSSLPVLVLAGALVLVGVAAVGYTAGLSASRSVAEATQPANIQGPNQQGPNQPGHQQVRVPTASGTVTSVSSGSVAIKQADGTSRTLTLTGSTTYTQGGATVTQSALVVGARITARGTVDSSGNFTATAVTIMLSAVQGTVASKTDTSIVVTTAAGKTVTVNVTASTKYAVRGGPSATLANISVGNRIAAQGTLNADGSITATVVQALTNVQPGFGNGGGGFPGGGRIRPQPSASPSGPSV